MDGFINSKIEAQTIYEIYRACRLCGAGAGYKMPIIQNVVDLDGAEVELKQKIRDCVQIEVHQDDKMPPLICELCVDKVNDFYEFLEMCRQTNKRTRLRLGLPPQTMPRGAPDAGDCILGITEPVFINEDSNEPLMRTRTQGKNLKSNVKNVKNKLQDTKVKITLPARKETRGKNRIQPRSLRSKQPSPPRLRGTKRSHDDDVSLGSIQRSKRTAVPLPKSILKKNEVDESPLLTPRLRGSKERESLKKEMESLKKETTKKVQIVVKSPPRVNKNQGNAEFKCKICKIQYNNHHSYNNHMRVHAKNKPSDRKPSKRSRDVECDDCKKTFLSKHLLDVHTCSAKAVNCDICCRKFPSNKAMSNHKRYCSQKKKATAISPALLGKVKPMQIRISRCDSILESSVNGHYDVSNVPFDYGLDSDCIYPYISRLRIKSEPSYMVDINDEIKEAFDADKYIHWDSEDTASDVDVEDQDAVKKVDSLTSIALKSIFSPKLLGKVPKKRRKVKAEKAFDSILNASDFDSDMCRGIDSLIDRLDDSIDVSKDKSGDNDSLFGDDKAPTVTNDDFDMLFGNTQNNDKNDDEVNVNKSREDNDSVNDERVGNEMIDNNENARSKDDTVCSESEKNVSIVNPVNDDDINKDNDESKKSESNDINNEESKINKTIESNDSEHNNDKIEESIENNESSKNNDENNVQNDDINEKCSLDKFNETESSEIISENESNDKNNDNEQSDDLNIDKVVTNIDQSNDTKVELKEDYQNSIDSKSDDTLQSQSLKMEDDEENTDNKDSTDSKNDVENVTMTDSTDKNEVGDVTMTEINDVNDVTNTLESTDDKTQEVTPDTDNEKGAQNDKTYVNGAADVEDKFNMDDLEDVSESEMDDKKLMDELDAQIGEDERKIV